MLTHKSGLRAIMAAALITSLGALPAQVAASQQPPPYRPRKPPRNTELEREIAEHNEVVERRRQERLARMAGR